MKVLLSKGNSKIGKDTYILNMSSATDCIARKLGFCKLGRKCYALKAERMYPQCLPYRRKQRDIWQRSTAEQIAAGILDTWRKARKKPVYLRVNESGDISGQSDIWKLSRIADQLRGKIKVYTYTARYDLRYGGISDNLTVNGSGFFAPGIGNCFKAVREVRKGSPVCPGNCRTCNYCKADNGLLIQAKIH